MYEKMASDHEKVKSKLSGVFRAFGHRSDTKHVSIDVRNREKNGPFGTETIHVFGNWLSLTPTTSGDFLSQTLMEDTVDRDQNTTNSGDVEIFVGVI